MFDDFNLEDSSDEEEVKVATNQQKLIMDDDAFPALGGPPQAQKPSTKKTTPNKKTTPDKKKTNKNKKNSDKKDKV